MFIVNRFTSEELNQLYSASSVSAVRRIIEKSLTSSSKKVQWIVDNQYYYAAILITENANWSYSKRRTILTPLLEGHKAHGRFNHYIPITEALNFI